MANGAGCGWNANSHHNIYVYYSMQYTTSQTHLTPRWHAPGLRDGGSIRLLLCGGLHFRQGMQYHKNLHGLHQLKIKRCAIAYIQVSWKTFRNDIIGPTNPEAAPATSIRGQIFANFSSLGATAALTLALSLPRVSSRRTLNQVP